MGRVKLKPRNVINGITARLPEVQGAVLAAGAKIEAGANAGLAAHRSNKDAQHHYVVGERQPNQKYGSIDYYIAIKGPAPVSMELGHENARKRGTHVQGLYLLAKAAGLV